MAAGTGGNPSFEIAVGYGLQTESKYSTSACQATLVHVDPNEGKCTMVTAAHCVADEGEQRPTFIRTADFGVITNFYIHFKGDPNEKTENDLATVHFTDGCGPDRVTQVIPLSNTPAEGVDKLGLPIPSFSASRAFRTLFAGFLPGNYRQDQKVVRITLSGGDVAGKDQTFATYSGDSGGGLFLKNPSTDELELLGVLSMGVYFAEKKNGIIPDNQGSVESVYVFDTPWIERSFRGNPNLQRSNASRPSSLRSSFDSLEQILLK